MKLINKYLTVTIAIIVMINSLWAAFEEYEVPRDRLSKITFPAGYKQFYQISHPKKIVPGQTLTVNVSIVKPDEVTINSITIRYRKKYQKINEYAPDLYIGHLNLPRMANDYQIEIIMMGKPFKRKSEYIHVQVEPLISSINFIGIPSQDMLSEVVRTRPGEFVNEMKLRVDLSHLKELGIFKSVSYNISAHRDGMHITYIVSLNPVVQEVKLIGAMELPQKKLLAELSLKSGEIFSSKKMIDNIRTIEDYYKEKGYIFAKVIDFERPTAINNYQVRFYINEGKINDIIIKGNNNTRDYVILREMELRKGMAFNAKLFKADLRNIYNLNYFSNIIPDIKTINDQRDVDVIIDLEEKKTSSINFGGGYGEVSGWFGFIDLYLDNIKGTAQSVLFKSSWGDRVTTYQIKYHNPWMWDRRVSFTAKMWATRSISYLINQVEQRNGWSTAIGRPIGMNLRESYSFSYEDVFVPNDRELDYKKRTFGYTIAHDTRDNFMNPRSGTYDLVGLSKALEIFGGTVDNWKLRLEHNNFFSLSEKQVFAFKGSYDAIFGDVSITDEYYVGSETTVRGYDYVFAKGSERVIFNIEYRYLFNEIFQGYLFYDIGQALYTVDETFENHHGWGAGQGFGMRFILPIGPIGLVYGWPQYKTIDSGTMILSIGYPF